eukprot:s478_g9.t1
MEPSTYKDLDPDYTLRLRDDDIVYAPWVPSGTSPGLVVPKCASFGGVNDKGALAISAPVAKAYLTSPFEVGVFNFSAERLLKFILNLEDVSVDKVEMDKAPFLPGHFVQTAGQNYVCYFYSMHDCLTPKKVKELKTKGLQFGGKQKSGMERWACEELHRNYQPGVVAAVRGLSSMPLCVLPSTREANRQPHLRRLPAAVPFDDRSPCKSSPSSDSADFKLQRRSMRLASLSHRAKRLQEVARRQRVDSRALPTYRRAGHICKGTACYEVFTCFGMKDATAHIMEPLMTISGIIFYPIGFHAAHHGYDIEMKRFALYLLA